MKKGIIIKEATEVDQIKKEKKMGTIKLKRERIKVEEKQEAEKQVKKEVDKEVKTEAVLKHNTANSRHYAKSNSIEKAVIYDKPVNYYDKKEQVWKAVDNAVKKNAAGYESSIGNFKVQVYENEEEKSLEISNEKVSMYWNYLGKIESERNRQGKKKFEIERVGRKSEESENALRLVGENDEEDLQYIFDGPNIKENILIKKRAEDYKYGFKKYPYGTCSSVSIVDFLFVSVKRKFRTDSR